MPYKLDDKIVVAVSSRALFDFDEANAVFDRHGVARYREYQMERLDKPADPGVACRLVRKLLRFNTYDSTCVEVIVLSRNDAVSGLRVFKSAKELGLDVTRGVFTNGRAPYPYLDPFRAVLFLSAQPEDVRGALDRSCPAATVYTELLSSTDEYPDELRIAFDGDAVLFGDSGETIYQNEGLDAFHRSEAKNATIPLSSGPFRPFIEALHSLQQNPPTGTPMRIRTALVTARNAPAHERAIRTLMDWNIEVDEAFFLGGVEKRGFLAEFRPDFFFDDQRAHCDPASKVTCTGHVPAGIANRPPALARTNGNR
jgi:5'-nucleotidase